MQAADALTLFPIMEVGVCLAGIILTGVVDGRRGLRELGIGLLPFAPLGRGFLTGQVKRAEAYPEGDFRRTDPRYQGENFDANVKATQVVFEIATAKNVKPGQSRCHARTLHALL